MTTVTPPPPSSTSAADPGCAPTEARAMGPDVAGQVAVVLKALADPLRLRMLSFLTASATGEACVCDIAGVADVSQPTVSHHLKVLKDVGLLTSERRGTWVWYSVVPEARRAVTALLESFAPAALDAARHRAQPLGGLTDVDAALARLADDLAPGTALDPGTVLRTVRESYAALVRNAGVSGHLVALTRRFAEQRLADLARTAAPQAPGRPPQVLFVCVANAGRSQLAAALLRHHAGSAVIARSAGSAPAGAVHDAVHPLLGDLGADDAYPKPLTDDAVRAADLVVTMGCGDTCPVIPGVRYEDWVVGDPALASTDGVAAIRDDLDARVRALLADLVPDLPLPVRPDGARRDDHPDHHRDEENEPMSDLPTTTTTPSALFVCVHNAGRSQMAAGFLRHLSGGSVEVRSAGSMPADAINPVAVEAMLEAGIDIRTERPKVLTPEAVQASDVVITMGCGDVCPIYPGKRYEDWALADPAGQGIDAVRPIRDEIRGRVLALLDELGVEPVEQHEPAERTRGVEPLEG